jgi:integrase
LGLCKQIFRQAVEDGLISRNPFQGFRGAVRSNKERQHYVELSLFQKALDQAPTPDWKCLLLLARLAGLRIPSEAAGLRWDHIEWDKHRIQIVDSKKTKHHEKRHLRYVPMPLVLEDQLQELRRSVPSEASHVFPSLDATSNLRSSLLRVLKRAEVDPWPKLWQNLRASAATDFARQLPPHVAAAICGHTTQIAQEHYWTVADADLSLALDRMNENVAKMAVERDRQGKVKPEAVTARNGSQCFATQSHPPMKTQGINEFIGPEQPKNGRRGTRTSRDSPGKLRIIMQAGPIAGPMAIRCWMS